MGKPDGERIATVEQHMRDIDSNIIDIRRVMESKFAETARSIDEIKIILQTQPTLREEITQLKIELGEVKKNQGTRLWIERAIAGISIPILTILVLSYLDKLR